jgi:hypothetical protein
MAVASIPAESPPANASAAEREAFGKQALKQARRSSHGEWAPASDRPDPSRSSSSRRPTGSRNTCRCATADARLAVHLYRGAAPIMAANLAATPSLGLLGVGVRRRPPHQPRRVRGAGELGTPADVRGECRQDAAQDPDACVLHAHQARRRGVERCLPVRGRASRRGADLADRAQGR